MDQSNRKMPYTNQKYHQRALRNIQSENKFRTTIKISKQTHTWPNFNIQDNTFKGKIFTCQFFAKSNKTTNFVVIFITQSSITKFMTQKLRIKQTRGKNSVNILHNNKYACGLKKFQRFNLKSGNLNTHNILLNEKGHLKIVNQLTYPLIEQFKSSLLMKNGFQNFNSPQQLRLMRQRRTSTSRSIKIHPNVSQTYSLGIIILEVSSFISGQQFYDIINMKMNQNLIAKAFSILQKLGYSPLLQNLIRVLISNQRDRPLPSQIYTAFRPYQKKILNLQRFEFEANRLYDSLYPSQVKFY